VADWIVARHKPNPRRQVGIISPTMMGILPSSVLVVEHDMDFVRQFAQTVTVLHLGKVLSEGTMEDVQQDPEVIRAYLGNSRSQRPQAGRLNGRREAEHAAPVAAD